MRPETIVALASGAGRAGVAVLRLSGPHAQSALAALTDRPLPKPRYATRRSFRDPRDGTPIDDGLALVFPAPNSFTGEDVVELHLHGGQAVVAAALDALIAQDGVRLAEPGEFTRRAFENGKLDLAEAEGLADLVDAETEGQRRQALRQMRGDLSARVEHWRAQMIEAMALLEAAIDFPDEELPADLAERVKPKLAILRGELTEALEDAARGERVREGYRIAILGAPNAGKSSLLNTLARREAAIVSDIPGTTRDVIEVRLVLAGFPVWIADTAGLRDAADRIEAEGVRRALARAEEADLRIGLVEANAELTHALTNALQSTDLLLVSKVDVAPMCAKSAAFETRGVSTQTGEGVAALEAWIAARVERDLAQHEAPALTRARHRACVRNACDAIARAEEALEQGAELAAEELRSASSHLARLTGRIDVEDLLDDIFSRFCIGK